MTRQSPREMPLISLRGFNILSGLWLNRSRGQANGNSDSLSRDQYPDFFYKCDMLRGRQGILLLNFQGREVFLSFFLSFKCDFLVKLPDIVSVEHQYMVLDVVLLRITSALSSSGSAKGMECACSICAQIM